MKLTHEQATEVVARIHIGNVKTGSTHIGHLFYCGRRNGLRPESALHNPHNAQGICRTCRLVHGTGGKTLSYFEPEFRAKVKAREPAIMNELRTIWRRATRGEQVTLLCWCTPAPCHTNIIKQVLFELAVGEL